MHRRCQTQTAKIIQSTNQDSCQGVTQNRGFSRVAPMTGVPRASSTTMAASLAFGVEATWTRRLGAVARASDNRSVPAGDRVWRDDADDPPTTFRLSDYRSTEAQMRGARRRAKLPADRNPWGTDRSGGKRLVRRNGVRNRRGSRSQNQGRNRRYPGSGYRSGLSSSFDTPDALSTARTRLAGVRPALCQAQQARSERPRSRDNRRRPTNPPPSS